MDGIAQPQTQAAADSHATEPTEPTERPVDHEANTARLMQAAATLQRDLDEARAEHRQAVSRYRELVLSGSPDLPPELVSGDSIAAIDAAVQSARELVARVRDRLTAAAPPVAVASVPAG